MEKYRIEELKFTYPGRKRAALCGIDLSIERGEFVTFCGPSGCGKTTLLRHLKPSTAPHGEKTGAVYFDGEPLDMLPARDAAAGIGFVLQSPENQIVTDKVWHELAFGLESLGIKTPEIRLRVAEMASFFGIQTWFHKPVIELSGGQKQLLALASIMALQPSALILDEPTSQLDPIAAGEFLATVGKINRELGVTIILTEHRLEEAFPLSSRAVVMDCGEIIADGTPRDVGLQLCGRSHGMFQAMPTPMRVWAGARVCDAQESPLPGKGVSQSDGGCDLKDEVPITVRDGANWLSRQSILFYHLNLNKPIVAENLKASTLNTTTSTNDSKLETHPSLLSSHSSHQNTAVELDGIWFKYEKNMPDVIKGLSLEVRYGEIAAILGGNGTGKTTTLSLIAGLNVPYRGKVIVKNFQDESRLASTLSALPNEANEETQGLLRQGQLNNEAVQESIYTLPQNPQTLFVAKTVREDLLEILSERKLPKEAKLRRLAAMVKLCRLEGLLDAHPYDLSGGEQQRAALAKVLLLQPKILLLDEPTKGLDAEFKQVFAAILKKLKAAGAAVVMASHDVEFCAEHADRCALFFDGGIVTENNPREFFSGNSFYTTGANRMARGVIPDAITAGDIIYALTGHEEPRTESEEVQAWNEDAHYDIAPDIVPEDLTGKKPTALSVPRRILVLLFAALLIATIVFTGVHFDGFKSFIGGGNEAVKTMNDGVWTYIGIMIACAAGLAGITLTLTWKREITAEKKTASERKLSKRTIAAVVMILLAIPVTIYAGSYFLGDRKYYFISLLIMAETMLPFGLVFESRKPQARELVIIAVLCAIAVAGRAAFFMLPQFKPVIAVVIISGIAFGGEAGFLVGAMSGFVSNFFFGQGPWTPWQMFSFGIIGFLAGLLFRKGFLRRSPVSLAVFGAFATIIVYGLIMDTSMVVLYQTNINRVMLTAAFLQGVPFNLVHAAATVAFLALISRPMLEKLDRIKVKYGLVD